MRGVLFGLLGAGLLASLLRPEYQGIALSTGGYNPELARVSQVAVTNTAVAIAVAEVLVSQQSWSGDRLQQQRHAAIGDTVIFTDQ